MHNYIYTSINIYPFSSRRNGLLTIKIYTIIKSQMEKVLVSESDWESLLKREYVNILYIQAGIIIQ